MVQQFEESDRETQHRSSLLPDNPHRADDDSEGPGCRSKPRCKPKLRRFLLAKEQKSPLGLRCRAFDWQRQLGGGSFAPAYDGQYIFYAGAKDSAELRQDIKVAAFSSLIDAGVQYFVFRGYIRTYPPKPARYMPNSVGITELIQPPLLFASSTRISLCNTTQWQLVRDSALAPKGTRLIRIRLISTRFDGAENDGYYDALSLIAPSVSLSVGSKVDQSPDGFKLGPELSETRSIQRRELDLLSPIPICRAKGLDLLGREVATLMNEQKAAGAYRWNGTLPIFRAAHICAD